MTLRQALYTVRRWRLVIFAGICIGAVVGWVSADGTRPVRTTFEATATMIIRPEAAGSSELKRLGPIATLGEVPSRVAARLGIDREIVQSRVYVLTPPDRGSVLIIGRSVDRAQAAALADVVADELIAELGGPNAPLRRLEAAVASPVKTGDIRPPSSRPGRALMLAAFGLVLGIAAAVIVDRFDNRVRSKSTAEPLGVPVMAEVPVLPRSDRDRLVSGVRPSSFIEAYRGLRSSVDRWMPLASNGDDARVIVVTSPTGGEGTTATVAHLAAAFGEVGRSVVAISANLRRPSLHSYFGKAQEPGLTDVLRGAPDARKLADLNLATTIRGVSLVASGAPVRNPAPLLDHVGDHLHEAQSLGDIVLVDAPPLLTTSDGSDLARHANGVLLVVRAGRTSVGAAARSVELLERLNIPVIGAVLVGSDGSAAGKYPKGSRRLGAGA